MTNSEPAAIVLGCWKQILLHANAKQPVRDAYDKVNEYFTQHPDEIVAHPLGHLGTSLKKKLPNFFARFIRKLFKQPTVEFENDFKTVLLYFSRRSLGRPSLEDRYAVFYTREQLDKNVRLFSKWGRPWQRALQRYFFKRIDSKEEATALRAGLIIGYEIVSHKDPGTVNVPLWGRSSREVLVIDDIVAHIVAGNSSLSKYLHALFDIIKPKLKESETYLIRYKTRNIASALSTSIVLSAPFVILGYVLDFYLLPTLTAFGMASIFWKISEIIIRYMQGSLDTVIQYYEIRKDHLSGGTCRDEENAAKWGAFASSLGPLAAIVAPIWGIIESSRGYAAVAIINATIDNLVSALRKAATNWANAKVMGLAAMSTIKHIFKDTYVFGNFIGAALIFLVDFGGRSLVPPTFFEFLRIVAVEGLVIGMLDSEITALLSRGMIVYQNQKWQKLLNDSTFHTVYQRVISVLPLSKNGAPEIGTYHSVVAEKRMRVLHPSIPQ